MSDTPTPVGRARELRKNMTEAERSLWKELRNRKFMGLKFVRQHPLIYQVINNEPRYFIADFICYEKKLVIEVDGKIHDFQKEDDEHREEILKSLGLTVLRIKNEEVEDIIKVLEKIKIYINEMKI
jgi:very-short-patch-repair endonuclease